MGASHARTLVAEGAQVVTGDILGDEGKALAQPDQSVSGPWEGRRWRQPSTSVASEDWPLCSALAP
jgi:hypothetical protein